GTSLDLNHPTTQYYRPIFKRRFGNHLIAVVRSRFDPLDQLHVGGIPGQWWYGLTSKLVFGGIGHRPHPTQRYMPIKWSLAGSFICRKLAPLYCTFWTGMLGPTGRVRETVSAQPVGLSSHRQSDRRQLMGDVGDLFGQIWFIRELTNKQ